MAPYRTNLIEVSNVLVFLTLLAVETSPVKVDESRPPRRCCDPGSLVTFDGESYACKTPPPDAPEFFEPLNFGQKNPGIPACENGANLTSIPLANANSTHLLSDFCIDVILNSEDGIETRPNDSPDLLYCTRNLNSDLTNGSLDEPRHLPTVSKIRRCCVRGEIFRIDRRACVPLEDSDRDISTGSLVRSIGFADFLYVKRGPPMCQHAIVDQEVNQTDVSIVNGRIQVTATNSNGVVDLLATDESACLESGSSPGLLVVRVCRGVEYCRGNTCLRKCCREDEALVETSCKKLPAELTTPKLHEEVRNLPNPAENSTEQVFNSTEYGLLVGKPCSYGMYAVLKDEKWHLVPEGKLHVPGYQTYGHHQHCMDMFYNSSLGPDGLYPFVCFEDPPLEENYSEERFHVNAVLQMIGCTFLLVTLLVYVCLPTLQNLHGKTLMCHVGSLFVAMACLAIVGVVIPNESQTQREDEVDLENVCTFLGYTMLFSFLSAFFWLNVMCFDIWWTFGSLRHSGRTNTKRQEDHKRFMFYCLYAWGFAVIFVIVAIAADYTEFLPAQLRPGMGVQRCWFSSGYSFHGEILFFTGPVSIQLIVNVVLFILTARRCSMVKADIQRRVKMNTSDSRSRRFHADKNKLILNVKLFVVMGISWILEVISYFLNHYLTNVSWKTEFFCVSDVFNCLQGLMIFVLFVLKKKVLHALRRKFAKGVESRQCSTAGVHDPYRVRKSPSTSTILSTFAVSSSP
ncbi:G-protein coupled receptor Mth2-like [Neodiprion fabricii]|uniref:G-protein coupled receptor Mth2-like n=1 Tax=Neodiprion fabricii TaxID=2872261 RepID=UPI001ED92EBA|nr:G-protein coupled receptor Mth2-like [Neodiprion fabricii]